jgi:hypothetical protein
MYQVVSITESDVIKGINAEKFGVENQWYGGKHLR